MNTQYPVDKKCKNLVDEIEFAKSVNDYDFKKLIQDFGYLTRKNEISNSIKHELRVKAETNAEKLKILKKKKEEEYLENKKRLEDSLKKKEQVLLTALQEKQKEKAEFNEKNAKLLEEKKRKAQKSKERTMLAEEEKRKRDEENILKKFDKFITKNTLIKQKTHADFSSVLQKDIKIHAKRLEDIRKKKKEFEKEREEKLIIKNGCIPENKKKVQDLIVSERKKKLEKLESFVDREGFERERKVSEEKKISKILERINRSVGRKQDNDMKKRKNMEIKKLKEDENFEKVKISKLKLEYMTTLRRKEILDYESEFFQRQMKFESAKHLSRNNSNLTNKINHELFESNIPNFKKQIYYLQTKSLLKKTDQEKYIIYKKYVEAKRRKERELKEKELEERQGRGIPNN